MIRVYLFFCVGILLGVSGCRSSESSGGQVSVVKAEVVRKYQSELQLSYPGRVKAAADVDLAFRVAGPIVRIAVEPGRFVRKGEVIAEIDPRDYELQYKATEAEYKQVKAEAERVIELYNRKSVPENDYDKAVYGLQQITSKYNAHKNAWQDTRLVAPFDGYIQKKYFEEGETVAAGIPVVSLINTRYFEVEIDVPAADYVRQDLFCRFSGVVDVFPDKVFPLEWMDVTKKANLNQLYQVRLRLTPDPEFPLAAGMSINVTIDYNMEEAHLMEVPLSAVFQESGSSKVWVYQPENKTVSQRNVKIRQILKDGRAILEEGVQSGEIVVTAGVHKLKEGMKVELLKPVSSTNIGGLL